MSKQISRTFGIASTWLILRKINIFIKNNLITVNEYITNYNTPYNLKMELFTNFFYDNTWKLIFNLLFKIWYFKILSHLHRRMINFILNFILKIKKIKCFFKKSPKWRKAAHELPHDHNSVCGSGARPSNLSVGFWASFHFAQSQTPHTTTHPFVQLTKGFLKHFPSLPKQQVLGIEKNMVGCTWPSSTHVYQTN